MSSIGDLSKSTSSTSCEDALVDVEQRHVAAEAAGSDVVATLGLSLMRSSSSLGARLARCRSRWARGRTAAGRPARRSRPACSSRAPTGQTSTALSVTVGVGVPPRPAPALTAMRLCVPRPTNSKTFLPSRSREARTQRAHRMQRLRSMKMSGCEASTSRIGNWYGILRARDAEAVGQGLQLAVAALLAEHAEVVALDEEHLDEVRRGARCSSAVSFSTTMPGATGWVQAACGPAVDQHRADPAAAVAASSPCMCAQPRDVDARRRRRPRRMVWPGSRLDLAAVDGECESGLAHDSVPHPELR